MKLALCAFQHTLVDDLSNRKLPSDMQGCRFHYFTSAASRQIRSGGRKNLPGAGNLTCIAESNRSFAVPVSFRLPERNHRTSTAITCQATNRYCCSATPSSRRLGPVTSSSEGSCTNWKVYEEYLCLPKRALVKVQESFCRSGPIHILSWSNYSTRHDDRLAGTPSCK